MATLYPSAAACNLCNTGQSFGTGHDCYYSSNVATCSKYCNSGCNCICNAANKQTICQAYSQYIHKHDDVGPFSWGDDSTEDIQKDDFIHQKWSKTFWDHLIDQLNTAENIGENSSQKKNAGSVSVTTPVEGTAITADFYNQIRKKIINFNNIPTSYSEVNQEQIITATLANTLKQAFNNAKFHPNVCDICNANEHMGGTCSCNCSCTCNCGCSCSCSCGANY